MKKYGKMENSSGFWHRWTRRGKFKLEIFQRESLSPLIFVIALMSLTLVLRTMKPRCSFGKGKGKLNRLLFMDDLKLYDSSDNDTDSLARPAKILSGEIGIKFDMDKYAVLKNKKTKTSATWRNRFRRRYDNRES